MRKTQFFFVTTFNAHSTPRKSASLSHSKTHSIWRDLVSSIAWDMTSVEDSCFSLLKTTRRNRTAELSHQVEHTNALLRRIKVHFPQYGEGFIYLILRELDFDYLQTLEALRTKSLVNPRLFSIHSSMTLNDDKGKTCVSYCSVLVRALLLRKRTNGDECDSTPIPVKNAIATMTLFPLNDEGESVKKTDNPMDKIPIKSATLTHIEQALADERNIISNRDASRGSEDATSDTCLWSSSDTCYEEADELVGETTPLPLLERVHRHSLNRNSITTQGFIATERETCEGGDGDHKQGTNDVLEHLVKDSPTILDEPRSSLDVASTERGLEKSIWSPKALGIPTNGVDNQCVSRKESSTSLSSYSSIQTSGTTETLNESVFYDAVEQDVTVFVSGSAEKIEAQKQELLPVLQRPDDAMPVVTKRVHELPEKILIKPRPIHDGRRRIVLRDDDDEKDTVVAAIREIPTKIEKDGTICKTKSNADALSEAAHDDASISIHGSKKIQPHNKAVCNDKDGGPIMNATYDLTLETASLGSNVIHPYTNALDSYLLREKKIWTTCAQYLTQITNEGDAPSPEIAGFRWLPEKRRFCRYALGSLYLRPRHKYLLGPKVYGALYDHQKASVSWMFELFKQRQGGILADEMGLGKTVQAIAFLRGLFSSRLATHAIILMPLTLIPQWKAHLAKWCADTIVCVYHGSRNERRAALDLCFGIPSGSNAVLLTTYETFRMSCKDLCRVTYSCMDARDRAQSIMTNEVRRQMKREQRNQKLIYDPHEQDDHGEEEQWFRLMSEEVQHNDDVGSCAWDVVLMDEAHKIKNTANKSAQAVRLLNAHCRILLTGTPVTNSLDELWSLMDCAVPGLLGTHRNFKKEFADVIKVASTRTASETLVAQKNRVNYELQQLVTPYFLRRTLKETLNDRTTPPLANERCSVTSQDPTSDTVTVDGRVIDHHCDIGNVETKLPCDEQAPKCVRPSRVVGLPEKTDVAVWIRLTATQHIIYETFLVSRDIRHILESHKAQPSRGFNSMQAVNVLLKLCRHPALLLPYARVTYDHLLVILGGVFSREIPAWWRSMSRGSTGALAPNNTHISQQDAMSRESQEFKRHDTDYKSQAWFQHVYQMNTTSAEDLRSCSGKLIFLFHVLPILHERQHRCLIFSQSTQMLDIIQVAVMDPLELQYLRIDGSVPNDIRRRRIDTFQHSNDIFALLMTTKVGGQGLNLTCADRVIIVDPDWTPANDNQAVARIYRLGQTIYRLLTPGAIEDHAFRLQTFKQGLSKIALDCTYQKAYFSDADMKKIFTLRTDGISETMQILDAVDPEGQKERQAFEDIVKEDISLDAYQVLAETLLVGLSNYDALYRELSKVQLHDDYSTMSPKRALKNAIIRLNQD